MLVIIDLEKIAMEKITVCRPVAKVDHLLNALQIYSAVDCFENSHTNLKIPLQK